jgi:hypothetical protein
MIDIAKKEGLRKLMAGAPARVMWTTPQVCTVNTVLREMIDHSDPTPDREYSEIHAIQSTLWFFYFK